MTNFILTTNPMNSWILPVVLVVLLILMIVMPMISQKKRMKQYNEMQDSLKVGDKIQTIGGIVGRITKVQSKDGSKTVLIETGDKNQKTVLEFDINAIAGPIVKINPVTEIQPEEETKPEEKVEEKDELLEQIELAAKEKKATKKSKK